MAKTADTAAGRLGRPGVNEAISLVATWIERHRSRRTLYSLDERMLRDIGLSRSDVEGEFDKPFWRN